MAWVNTLCSFYSKYYGFTLVFQIITQFKEQGLNTELYYKNKEMGETYSIVPTSAITYEYMFIVFNLHLNRQLIHL